MVALASSRRFSPTHDVKGNTTSIPGVLRPGTDPLAMKWDIENDATDDVTYQWDALLRRVGRDDGTTATIYVQNGQQTVADYTSGTAATSPTYTYIYASYIDEPVVRAGGSGLRYYHRNQQYSITAMTNGGGTVTERYAYDAYGTPTIMDDSGVVLSASAENNRYLYTGREWDSELSLYHYRARMYGNGRFLSRDPIGHEDGMSLYSSYFQLSFTDPSGQSTSDSPYGRCVQNAMRSQRFEEHIIGRNYILDLTECELDRQDCENGIEIIGMDCDNCWPGFFKCLVDVTNFQSERLQLLRRKTERKLRECRRRR